LSCILDLRFACLELFQQHDDALEHIDRFETGDNDRLPFVPRDPLVRAASMMVGPWPGPMNASMRISNAGMIVT
jgi:hypothetical protein